MTGLVSRYNGLYSDRGGLEAARFVGPLYRNTIGCIMTKGARRLGIVSRGRPRYGHAYARTRPRYDAGASAIRPCRPATRPRAMAMIRRQRPATRPRTRASGHACAHWLGQIGCLVHLTQFDSVFGLSTVSESPFGHCS